MSLGFDSLEIPFEEVVSPAEADDAKRLATLQTGLASQINELELLQARSSDPAIRFSATLGTNTLGSLAVAAGKLEANSTYASVTNFPELKQAVSNVTVLVHAFQNWQYNAEVISNQLYGLEPLKVQQLKLKSLSSDFLSGKDITAYQSDLDAMEKLVKQSVDAMKFYTECANLLQSPDLLATLTYLSKVTDSKEWQSGTAHDQGTDLIRKLKAALEYRNDATLIAGLNVGPTPAVPAQAGATTAPLAAFTATPATGAAPLSVTFTDTSKGSVTNRLWSFGDHDQATSTNSPATHSYTNVSTYTVSLTVYGMVGTNTLASNNCITVTNSLSAATKAPPSGSGK